MKPKSPLTARSRAGLAGPRRRLPVLRSGDRRGDGNAAFGRALAARSPWTSAVVTGRDAPGKPLAQADAVTVLRKLEHHYDAGVPARRGTEE
jgi:hypothetical protein